MTSDTDPFDKEFNDIIRKGLKPVIEKPLRLYPRDEWVKMHKGDSAISQPIVASGEKSGKGS